MYKIVIEQRVAKEIESLPNEIIQDIIDSIQQLKTNARPYGVKKLIGGVG